MGYLRNTIRGHYDERMCALKRRFGYNSRRPGTELRGEFQQFRGNARKLLARLQRRMRVRP